ncbi:sensor histidine kinase [Nocardioides ultimimeridianus]
MGTRGRSSSAPWPEWALAGVVGLSSLTVLLEPRDTAHPLIGLLEGALIVFLAMAAALLADDEAQRGNATLLCLVGACLAIEHLRFQDDTPFPLMSWIAGPLAGAMLAVVLVRFPGPRLSPRGHRWARAAIVVLVVTRLTVTVTPDHLRQGWWPTLPLPTRVADLGLKLGNAYILVLAAWFLGLMGWRLTHNKGAARHELAPVVFAAIGATLAVAGHVVSVFGGHNLEGLGVLVVEQLGLLAVPAGFIFAALSMRTARGAVGDLLLQVRASSTPTEIEASLATTLSDPDLTLFVWAAEEGHWRRASGHRQNPVADASQLVVRVDAENGGPLAAIVTDASIARHGQLVDASAAAVRLALQNAATMGQLRRSRTRLAQAELAERKRLERDLHDGVQQRLLALGMSLDRVVHAASDDHTRALATAAAGQVREAITELRDLARGILPAVLTQSGLAAAVESAAERLPLLVTSAVPGRRWPMATEATAYFVICEGLSNVVKHARAERAEVEVGDDGRMLVVVVRDQGVGGADLAGGSGLLGLRDRVTALGGSFMVESSKGVGTCLTATLPYE